MDNIHSLIINNLFIILLTMVPEIDRFTSIVNTHEFIERDPILHFILSSYLNDVSYLTKRKFVVKI